MKKFLVASMLFVCLMACNNNNSGADKNIATSKEIFQGMETGDTAKLSSIAADAVDHAGPHGDVKNGDSIRAYLADMHNHIKDLKFEILGNAVDGDYVYTWSKMTGTPTDSLMGFPAGVPVSVQAVDIIRYNNGKAVEHWGNVDEHYLMASRALQTPNGTLIKVTVGDTSSNKKDTGTKK